MLCMENTVWWELNILSRSSAAIEQLITLSNCIFLVSLPKDPKEHHLPELSETSKGIHV